MIQMQVDPISLEVALRMSLAKTGTRWKRRLLVMTSVKGKAVTTTSDVMTPTTIDTRRRRPRDRCNAILVI